jgi:AraC-like DNA-binding protein
MTTEQQKKKSTIMKLNDHRFSLVRRPSLADVERLDGIEEIRGRIKVLVRDVKSEVMTLAPDGAQRVANVEAARKLLERGVQLRTVYLDSVRNSPVTCDYEAWLVELGGEVRTAASLPTRLVIKDREVAIVPTDGENSGAVVLILTGSGTITALCALFESIWDKAVPLGAGSARHRDERRLAAQEAEVLRLLGQELTDDVTAKRLGVPPRTARRIAADLMDLPGARSRFQAGRRAVESAMAPDTRRCALLAQIHAYIRDNLGDVRLTPGAIATAHHISVRYLHKLFHAEGLTVAGLVRERRLEQCRHDLADPQLAACPINAIAARWGFTSPAHFSRAFRSAYGLSPRQFRQQCTTVQSRWS